MSHITTEQALQIPQQLKKQGSQGGSHSSTPSHAAEESARKGILSDDAVTLLRLKPNTTNKTLSVNHFKTELGQDATFVKETLKAKLSEYNLNPNTQVLVKRDMFGSIDLKGAILQTDIERIKTDLNNSQAFKDAFGRLSQQQPTLNYVDNVVKLTNAYGVGNSLFNSLVSDEQEFNQLNDISHRYEALKSNAAETPDSEFNSEYEFILNGARHLHS